MKTWIFDERKLDEAVERWVQRQIRTGHEKAIRNAEFVGLAIKDMLLGDSKLFKESPEASGYVRSSIESLDSVKPKDKPQGPKISNSVDRLQEGFSIDDLKSAWESMGEQIDESA